MALDDAEVVKRIRAARSYAGMNQAELGDAIEVSGETIKRIEAGTRKPKDSELMAIADKTEMPRMFFLMDFAELEIPGLLEIQESGAALEEVTLAPGAQRNAGAALVKAADALQRAAEQLLESELDDASGQSGPSDPDTEESGP